MADTKAIRPLNVGVIGTGMISGIYLDNMINRFDILNVTSIAARNYDKTIKVAEKYGIKACTVDELVADPDIDIVVNLTPAETREEIINKILDAGKHAYTEKAFAPDTKIAAALCAKADEKGLYLGSAPDTFLCGWVQTARQVIDSGRLGRITSFVMAGNRDNDLLLSIMPFMNKPGGGVVMDYSVYYLTALVNLLGPVSRLSATVKNPYPERVNIAEQSPDYGKSFVSVNESQFYSVLELESGVTGTFSINSDSALIDQTYFAIYGTKGIMYLGCPDWFNGEVRIYENTYDFSKAFTPEIITVVNPFGYNDNSRGVGVADMAWAITEGREMRASKERAYHVLDVQESIFKSSEANGAFVDIESTCERSVPLTAAEGSEEQSLRTL